MTQSSPPELEPLTRNQILMLMGVQAVVFMIFAQGWRLLGNVTLLPIVIDGQSLLLSVGLALLVTLLSSLTYYLWDDYRRSADFYLEFVVKPLIWADLLWLGLLPGLSEELLFRGVMLSALGENAIALIISSLIFGILHFSGTRQVSYVIWATLMGFVLGYSALATGNLLIPIVAHIITNWISSIVWKLKHPPSLSSESD